MNSDTRLIFSIGYNAHDPFDKIIPIKVGTHADTFGKALLQSFLSAQENGVLLNETQDADAITIRMVNNRKNNSIDVTYFVYPKHEEESDSHDK